MTQSRMHSAFETTVSTVIGFVVSWAATMIILPWFGFPVTSGPALGIVTIYTALSLLRGYFVRRFFNHMAKR